MYSSALNVSPQDLARYAVGLANARGGTVLVGVDVLDLPAAERDAGELHPLMVTHAIFELSGGRLTVNVQHHRLPGARGCWRCSCRRLRTCWPRRTVR